MVSEYVSLGTDLDEERWRQSQLDGTGLAVELFDHFFKDTLRCDAILFSVRASVAFWFSACGQRLGTREARCEHAGPSLLLQ
jgi:hypothetical protein